MMSDKQVLLISYSDINKRVEERYDVHNLFDVRGYEIIEDVFSFCNERQYHNFNDVIISFLSRTDYIYIMAEYKVFTNTELMGTGYTSSDVKFFDYNNGLCSLEVIVDHPY